MKRIWLLLIIMVVGCSRNVVNKKLDCEQKIGEMDFELIMDFDGNRIGNIDFKCTSDLSKYNEKQINAIKEKDLCKTVRETMKGFENSFISCDQEISDNKLLISSKLDTNKITSNGIREVGSIEEGKILLENDGYTCTIK